MTRSQHKTAQSEAAVVVRTYLPSPLRPIGDHPRSKSPASIRPALTRMASTVDGDNTRSKLLKKNKVSSRYFFTKKHIFHF